MGLLYFGLLVVSLLVNTSSGSSVTPTQHISIENGPHSAWACQTTQGETEVIESTAILGAANSLIKRWSQDPSVEVAANSPYHRLPTSDISYWPESTEDEDDPHWLCNLNPWVGSHPIPGGSADLGSFRTLLSSSYRKTGAGADVALTFAFCGVVRQVGGKFDMCWPHDKDEDVNPIGTDVLDALL